MKVTNVKASQKEVPGTGIIGYASCVINDTIAVNSITIRQSKSSGQAFMEMPQQKNAKTGNYQDVAFPITKDDRATISDVVLNKFYNPDSNQNNEKSESKADIDVQLYNVKSNKDAKSSVLARGSITIDNEFVIKGVKVVLNKEGKPFVSLPSSYNAASNESYSIIAPASKSAYTKISSAVLGAYQQNLKSAEKYLYAELTEKQIAALSSTTDIKFDIGKIQLDGSGVVRINSADKAKFEQVLGFTNQSQQRR